MGQFGGTPGFIVVFQEGVVEGGAATQVVPLDIRTRGCIGLGSHGLRAVLLACVWGRRGGGLAATATEPTHETTT